MFETHHPTNGLQSPENGQDLLGKECDGEERAPQLCLKVRSVFTFLYSL